MKKNKLYIGDNLQALYSFEKWKQNYDLVIIDPPYNSEISSLNYDDKFSDDEYFYFIRNRLVATYKVMNEDSTCLIQIDENGFDSIYESVKDVFGGKFKILIWDKLGPKYSPKKDHKLKGKSKNIVRTSHEYIFVCYKSNKDLKKIDSFFNVNLNKTFKTIYSDKKGTNVQAKLEIAKINDSNFRTPKPIKLMKDLISLYRNKDEMLVLDLFGGSGSSLDSVSPKDTVHICEFNNENINLIKRRDKNIEIIEIENIEYGLDISKEFYSKYEGFNSAFKSSRNKPEMINALIVISLFMRYVVVPSITEANYKTTYKFKNYGLYKSHRNSYIHEFHDIKTYESLFKKSKKVTQINARNTKNYIRKFLKIFPIKIEDRVKIFKYSLRLNRHFIGDFKICDFVPNAENDD